MAAIPKQQVTRKSRVDYHQLHNLSSAILYDVKPHTKRRAYSRKFMVERILSRKKSCGDHEYLIKWQGWPLHFCTWEPTSHLSPQLIRTYENPTRPSDERLEKASRNFYSGIITNLKGVSQLPFYVLIEMDTWRYISHNKGTISEHRGCMLYERNELTKFKFLPDHWWFFMNEHVEGKAIDFPIKIKPMVSWTPAHYVVTKGDKLIQAPRMPLEKLCITIVRRACDMNNVLL